MQHYAPSVRNGSTMGSEVDPSPSPASSEDSDNEDGGNEDSDEEAPMTISEGLSLRKSTGRRISRDGKKHGRTLFAMDILEERNARRWKVMFAAIRYDYVAHGPTKPVPSAVGHVYDDREYIDMFNSRYRRIFGSSAPPMTPVEVAAVFPAHSVF
jgi:hypothetical protein